MCQTTKLSSRVHKIPHSVKALATKLDILSSIPETHMVGGNNSLENCP